MLYILKDKYNIGEEEFLDIMLGRRDAKSKDDYAAVSSAERASALFEVVYETGTYIRREAKTKSKALRNLEVGDVIKIDLLQTKTVSGVEFLKVFNDEGWLVKEIKGVQIPPI